MVLVLPPMPRRVSAVVQTFHALLDAVGGGEHQHRQRRAARAQPLEHLQAVQFRQSEVEDQQVELVVGHQRGVGFAAAGHVVHRRTGRAQAAQQTVGQNLVVFCNQDAHGEVSCAGRAALLWSRSAGRAGFKPLSF
jgi:hypothetical protein